jgi:hypothetical protein
MTNKSRTRKHKKKPNTLRVTLEIAVPELTEVHWSGALQRWFCSEGIARASYYATPEEAWRRENKQYIAQLLNRLGRREYAVQSIEEADRYRRKHPIPPVVQKVIARYVKQHSVKVKPYTLKDFSIEITDDKVTGDFVPFKIIK